MAQQHIQLGTPPAGTDGDTARQAFSKAEANFSELYDLADQSGEDIAAATGRILGNNLLINSEFFVNQEVFAGGALAAGAYGYDMWKAGAGGCNVSANASGLITHTSGPLVQIVEAPSGVYGQQVAFSVEDPSANIAVTVGGVAGVITAGAGRRGVVLTMPAGSGDLTVQLSATGATYRRPALERGSTWSAFSARPRALELLLCQRYYEKSYELGVAKGTNTNTGRRAFAVQAAKGQIMWCSLAFAVPKRVAPAVTIYSVTGVAGQVTQGSGAGKAVTVGGISSQVCELSWTNDASDFGGFFHFVADARP